MATHSQPTTHGDAIPVAADDVVRTGTDASSAGVGKGGGFGTLTHYRYVRPTRAQAGPGTRRKLYSTGVFDLDAGEVCIVLPDAGKRFMSMMVFDENHVLFTVVRGNCTHTFTRRMLGTRYMRCVVRILVDPRDSKDIRQAHLVQDRIRLEQEGGPGTFELPTATSLRIRRRSRTM